MLIKNFAWRALLQDNGVVNSNAAAALAVMILAAVVPLVVVQQSLPREGRYGAT